jgi:hypothetical protein
VELLSAICPGRGAGADAFGCEGERTTSDLLRSRRVRRAGWQVVHNVPFDHERVDVDHVLFGPAGVLAIESKWADTEWRVRSGSIQAPGGNPVDQAWRGARKIRYLLLSAGIDVRVVPVVLQWGPSGLVDAQWSFRWFEDGVLVLRGRRSKAWIDRLGSFTLEALSAEQIAKARVALETRIDGRALASDELEPVSAGTG